MRRKSAPAAGNARRGLIDAIVVMVAVAALALISLGTAQALTVRHNASSATDAAGRTGTPTAVAPAPQVAMTDHGGAVLPTADLHVIWWGPTASFPADQRSTIEAEVAGLQGSSYQKIVNEYLRGGSAQTTFNPAHVWADTSTPPAGDATADQVAAEVARYLAATGQQADAHAVYLVYSTAPVIGENCAWHNARAVNAGGASTLINVAYIPDATHAVHCDAGVAVGSMTTGTRAAATSTAHEILEAMSDPIPGATWVDAANAEIGDICSSEVRAVTLAGGVTVPLQALWSNNAHTCITAA